MHPQHMAANIKKPSMQAISVPEANSRHPRSPRTVIMQVAILDSFDPEIAQFLVAFFAG
jgi:hypothetical protein